MDYLDRLENESLDIIREACYQFPDVAMLWSVGKDSTTLLWLIRKAFLGTIPFPVIHIDTGRKFPEMDEIMEEVRISKPAERSGTAQPKENLCTMEKSRALG